MLQDGLGRSISYLRLSVTDRCNLACSYCSTGPRRFIPHQDILRYEECSQLISLALRLGVQKVRFTGGEPFVRKGFAEFVVTTLADHPDLDLRITTNATLLRPHLPALKRAGLAKVNISLDTLDPQKYQRITGHDSYHEVRSAIDACLDVGIGVKVNAVAMRGVNDDELPALLELARSLDIDLRFIEYMPVGAGNGWGDDAFWSGEDILASAREITGVTPVDKSQRTSGPARMFDLTGGGRLGIISAVSCHFCDRCNRLRVTSDGRLRTCLFSDKTYNLRPLIRHPRLGMTFVQRVIAAAIQTKPEGHKLLEQRRAACGSVCLTRMHSIGG